MRKFSRSSGINSSNDYSSDESPIPFVTQTVTCNIIRLTTMRKFQKDDTVRKEVNKAIVRKFPKDNTERGKYSD
jgi:hypothetical protein